MKFKNYINQKMKGLALFIGLGLSSTVSFAQMNGSYTIDASVAASSTNYTTWASFATAWNAAAITGPVTVTVKSSLNIGLNAITLNANTGSSTTNTLSIDGGNTRMTYTGTNAALRLNGADYVSVKNMVIENTNISSPGGVTLTNQADYNEFNAVDVFLNGYSGTSSSTFYYAISASTTTGMSNGSAATGTTGQPGSFNKIRNCKMYTQTGGTGPYTAVGLNGNTANYTTTAQNNTMEGCTISNFYYYGVFMQYPNGNEVLNNDISRSNTTTGGSSTMYAIYENNRANSIAGSKIYDLPFKGATNLTTNLSTFYGIALNYPIGNATYRILVDGNSIKDVTYGTGGRYVYWINNSTLTDVTNNISDNVDGSSTGTTNYDYFINYPTDVKVNGNTATNGGTHHTGNVSITNARQISADQRV